MLGKIFKTKKEKAKIHDEKIMKILRKKKQKILLLEESKKEPKNLNNTKNQEKINKKIEKLKEAMKKMAKKLKIKDGKLVMNTEEPAPEPASVAQPTPQPTPVAQPTPQPTPVAQPTPTIEPVEIPSDPQPLAVEQDIAQQQAQINQVNQDLALQQAQQQALIEQENIRQRAYAQAMADLQRQQTQQVPVEPNVLQMIIILSNDEEIRVPVYETEVETLDNQITQSVNEKVTINLGTKKVNGSQIVSWQLEE